PGIPETASLGPDQSPQRSAASDRSANGVGIIRRESNNQMRFHTVTGRVGHSTVSAQCPNCPGGFKWSAQHVLILLDEKVANGDVTDIDHGEAEGRTLGALEERTKCVAHLPGAGKEEQDRRPADRGSQWRDRSGAPSQGCGGVEA